MTQIVWKPFIKLAVLLTVILLASCGGGDLGTTANLSGQVSAVTNGATSKVTHFAASRF